MDLVPDRTGMPSAGRSASSSEPGVQRLASTACIGAVKCSWLNFTQQRPDATTYKYDGRLVVAIWEAGFQATINNRANC